MRKARYEIRIYEKDHSKPSRFTWIDLDKEDDGTIEYYAKTMARRFGGRYEVRRVR